MAADDKPSEPKTERFNMFMSPSEMKAIDEWAWKNRIRSKSEAVRRLVQMALIQEDLKSEINKRMMDLLSNVLLLADETLREVPHTREEMSELKNLSRDIFSDCYSLYDKLLEQTIRMGGLSDGDTSLSDELDWGKRATEFLEGKSLIDSFNNSPTAMSMINQAAEKARKAKKDDGK